jgi:anti-sigma regulatory factor (Ser/Thr protein kinase)
LSVRHVAESAGQVRRHLVDDLTRRGLPRAVIEDAALLVTELVSNAVRYANPLPGDTLRVAWELTSGGLLVRVTDSGGRDAPHRLAAGPHDVRGRGLAIVESLAARWGIERAVGQLNTVWAELPLNSRAPKASAVDGAPTQPAWPERAGRHARRDP